MMQFYNLCFNYANVSFSSITDCLVFTFLMFRKLLIIMDM